jgi:short-subunit dehydrogenase
MAEHAGKVVVVTGASAGVGRAVALKFAKERWRVGLIARSPIGLASIKSEIEALGGEAASYPADVADANALFEAADKISRLWDRIDVWVNNAMVTLFAPFNAISPEEFRRVTEVTYLGYVHGTMAALAHMRERNAGTIVQVGSALSYRAIPLQSAYCGAKFAIRGFTESLRSELQHDGSAIRVTMVQLPAVNTPQFDWARNKLGFRAQPLPPIHQPEAVAEHIFQASQSTPRELWLGMPSLKAILGNMAAPGLMDWLLSSKAYKGQHTSERQSSGHIDNLFDPAAEGHIGHGRFDKQASAGVTAFNPARVRAVLLMAAVTIVLLAFLIPHFAIQ